MTSYSSIRDSFLQFHELCFNDEFTKTWIIKKSSEREISIPLRFYLSAWFENVKPEARAHECFQSNIGRPYQIDFLVGDLAVEVATSTEYESISKLYAINNVSEIRKLSKYNGKSVLCLLDFREYESRPNTLFMGEYVNRNELGPGNHGITNYKVMYFYRHGGRSRHVAADAFPGR